MPWVPSANIDDFRYTKALRLEPQDVTPLLANRSMALLAQCKYGPAFVTQCSIILLFVLLLFPAHIWKSECAVIGVCAVVTSCKVPRSYRRL